MWTSGGAAASVEPEDWSSRLKWRLIRNWFAPDKTISKQLYSSLGPTADDADLGGWARFKKRLLHRWLPQIRFKERTEDEAAEVEMAEQGISTSAPASLRYEPATITQLAKMSTPIAMADAEPNAVQQITTYGLQPLSARVKRKRSGSAGSVRHSEERPSSTGSSGIMLEERNISDSESDIGEDASAQQQPSAAVDDAARETTS